MIATTPYARYAFFLVIVATAGGCTESEPKPRLASVSGMVSLEGIPLQDGTVALESSLTGYAACAPLDVRGRFAIEKIPVGTYTVIVLPPQIPSPGDPPRDATKEPARSIPEEY